MSIGEDRLTFDGVRECDRECPELGLSRDAVEWEKGSCGIAIVGVEGVGGARCRGGDGAFRDGDPVDVGEVGVIGEETDDGL